MSTLDRVKVEKVKEASEKVDEAKKAYAAAVVEAYPQGAIVEFYKGRSLIEAEILFVSDKWWSDPSVKIRNLKTGKEYWVESYWLRQTEQPDWWLEA